MLYFNYLEVMIVAQNLKYFVYGTICTLLLIFMGAHISEIDFAIRNNRVNTGELIETSENLLVMPDTVVIEALPTFRTLNGINVPFRGKTSFQQVIVGRYAKNIIIPHFKATGENAHKSVIEITWEDGTIDLIPAGTIERHFPQERRAKKIVIHGYSVHERRVFHDSTKPGVLDWEILYIPAEE